MSHADAAGWKVRRIFISPGHNFFGRHGKPAGDHPTVEVDAVECVAGHGLRGDRFFGYRTDYRGQVTFFAEENFAALCRELELRDASPGALRRNVVTAGADLNAWIGRRFTLQGVVFEGVEECRPCHWMDGALGPGAAAWLRSRGGLRCRVLSDGWLRRDGASGPAQM